jgi:hypothetical protein
MAKSDASGAVVPLTQNSGGNLSFGTGTLAGLFELMYLPHCACHVATGETMEQQSRSLSFAMSIDDFLLEQKSL